MSHSLHPHEALTAETLRRQAQNRPGFWLAAFLFAVLSGTVSFAVLSGWASLDDLSRSTWLIWGIQIGLAITPALLWLALFIIFERKNGALYRNALLLWLVAMAFYLITVIPATTQLFEIGTWLHTTWWSDLGGHLLVLAPLDVFFVYLLLHYGTVATGALHIRIEGVIYGVAAFLGVASLSGLWLTQMPGFAGFRQELFAINTLTWIDMALGGWLGYFVAQTRYKRTHLFYLPAGILLVILLHGLAFTVLDFLASQIGLFPIWTTMLFAGLFASLSFILLYWRFRRESDAFLHMATLLDTMPPVSEEPESLLADVVQMVTTQQLAKPQAPNAETDAESEGMDEFESLKESWEALISEQETDDDSI